MNYANMGIKRRVLIRQNQSNFESVQRKKNIKKDLKNQNANISFVFLDKFLCKIKGNFRHSSRCQNQQVLNPQKVVSGTHNSKLINSYTALH